MDVLNNILPAFNLASIVIFVGLALLAAIRMIWRFGNFIFFGFPVPVLLKRDIVLFSALALYFGTVLLALLYGWTGLSAQWWWIIPRGLMVLGAMAYWVKVEYSLEDNIKSPDDKEKIDE